MVCRPGMVPWLRAATAAAALQTVGLSMPGNVWTGLMAETIAGLSWPRFGKRVGRSVKKQALPSGFEIGQNNGAR
jgi:hypothetical protein